MNVRRASPSDAPALGRVHVRAWQAAYRGIMEAGFARAVLWVATGNERARRFYERAGWRDNGEERTAELLGVTVPEVRYERDLAPVTDAR